MYLLYLGVCDICDSELPLELDLAILTLSPGTCMSEQWECIDKSVNHKQILRSVYIWFGPHVEQELELATKKR